MDGVEDRTVHLIKAITNHSPGDTLAEVLVRICTHKKGDYYSTVICAMDVSP